MLLLFSLILFIVIQVSSNYEQAEPIIIPFGDYGPEPNIILNPPQTRNRASLDFSRFPWHQKRPSQYRPTSRYNGRYGNGYPSRFESAETIRSYDECTFSKDCQSLRRCKGIQDASCVCKRGKCIPDGNPFWRGSECNDYTDCGCRNDPSYCFCRNGECLRENWECHEKKDCKKMSKCKHVNCRCSYDNLCEPVECYTTQDCFDHHKADCEDKFQGTTCKCEENKCTTISTPSPNHVEDRECNRSSDDPCIRLKKCQNLDFNIQTCQCSNDGVCEVVDKSCSSDKQCYQKFRFCDNKNYYCSCTGTGEYGVCIYAQPDNHN